MHEFQHKTENSCQLHAPDVILHDYGPCNHQTGDLVTTERIWMEVRGEMSALAINKTSLIKPVARQFTWSCYRYL
jgi:hypothetical protein